MFPVYQAKPKCQKCGRGLRKGRMMTPTLCKPCRIQEAKEHEARDREIVAKGVCPECGRKLKHNAAILGWWQCEQFGAPQWRKEPTQPSCPFQVVLPQEVP